MSEQISYIYALYAQETDKVRYIGRTSRPDIRLRQHKSSGNIASGRAVESWIGKVQGNGLDIQMAIVEECKISNAVEREKFWITRMREQGASLTNSMHTPSFRNRVKSQDCRGRINFTPSVFDKQVIDIIAECNSVGVQGSSGAIRAALKFYHDITEMQELDLHLSKLIAERLEIRYDDSDKTD